jgi:hypothetical protein
MDLSAELVPRRVTALFESTETEVTFCDRERDILKLIDLGVALESLKARTPWGNEATA